MGGEDLDVGGERRERRKRRRGRRGRRGRREGLGEREGAGAEDGRVFSLALLLSLLLLLLLLVRRKPGVLLHRDDCVAPHRCAVVNWRRGEGEMRGARKGKQEKGPRGKKKKDEINKRLDFFPNCTKKSKKTTNSTIKNSATLNRRAHCARKEHVLPNPPKNPFHLLSC